MLSIGPDEVVFLGSLISMIGAWWSMACFARRTREYGPLVVLVAGSLSMIGGNAYGYNDEPMSYLQAAALPALALGFAVSTYTALAMRNRGAVAKDAKKAGGLPVEPPRSVAAGSRSTSTES